jgi:hypothetical protein
MPQIPISELQEIIDEEQGEYIPQQDKKKEKKKIPKFSINEEE